MRLSGPHAYGRLLSVVADRVMVTVYWRHWLGISYRRSDALHRWTFGPIVILMVREGVE